MALLNELRNRFPFRPSRPESQSERPDLDPFRLFEKAGFLIAEIDRSGLVRSANPRLCRMRGVEPGDVLGTGLPYLVDAEARPRVIELIHTAFAGLEGGEVVGRLLTTSGAPMPTIRWTLIPIPGPEGRISSLLAVGTDLTNHLPAPSPPRPDPEALEALREEIERAQGENRRLQKELRQLAARPSAPTPPLPDGLLGADEETLPTLAEIERRHILHTLEETGNRISGPKGAATLLGLHPNTLRSRMEKHGIVLGA